MNLLPTPRLVQRRAGRFVLPRRTTLQFSGSVGPEEERTVIQRLQTWNNGIRTTKDSFCIQPHPSSGRRRPAIRVIRSPAHILDFISGVPNRLKRDIHGQAYLLEVNAEGVLVHYEERGGLAAAVATLRQLLREYGRRLPCLIIRDWPDFPRRGSMLDVSRGRVPTLGTLLDLVDKLADFKINELQLYTEHTFAYRDHKSVWRSWGALTAAEIRKLDARCQELGIDLVPNQNSFGHLREFLASPKLSGLGEIAEPWPDEGGSFWRYPSTLAPNHRGTLPFLRKLYDELLPNFTSRFFNTGCDETWDLGRGRSRRLCQTLGRERVYLNFLKRIHREVTRRGRRMMFWGDIILRKPGLIRELPKDIIALNWGYESNHPFKREVRRFARAGVSFYVCPGTSTWASLIGKHDNAFANLLGAAQAGRTAGAMGYLIADWGDGGHPQPLAVSWLPFLFGAAAAWNEAGFIRSALLPAASRDIFHDPSGTVAHVALALGLAHRKLAHSVPNATPLGAAIAAPRPETHELFCRDGLKYYARIPAGKLHAARREIERLLKILQRRSPRTASGRLLIQELVLASRMAIQSCNLMLWQQALANGERTEAKRMARNAIRELRELEQDFNSFWPKRNKNSPARCAPFLQWRIADYMFGRLHFPIEIARDS